MAVTVGELLVKIGADTAELRTGFKMAEESLKGFEKTAKALGTILGGGYLAAQAKQMGVDLTNAASAAESEMARVEATVKAAGASWEELGPKIEAYSQSMIRLGFDDEQTATSVAKLLNVTRDYGEALKLNQTAMDLARYKGIDLDTATTALSRAWAGNTKMLKEFGIEVESGAGKLEILGAITDKVRGQSEAFANTSVGKMEALNVRWANLQEIIGARLLPVMDKLVAVASRFMDWMSQLSPQTQNLIGGLTGLAVAAGVAVPAIIALNAAAGALQISLGSLAIGLGAAAAVGALVVVVSELMNAEDGAANATSRLVEAQDKETKQTGQLLDQYKQLASRAKLTADEKQRMHDLSNQIAEKIPDAVKGYDKEHNAVLDLKKAYAELNEQLTELDKKRKAERDNQLAVVDRQIRDERSVPDIIRRAAAERAKSIQGQMLSPEAMSAALRQNTAALEKGLRDSNERLKKLMQDRENILNPQNPGGSSNSGQSSDRAKEVASIDKAMEDSLAKAETMERVLKDAFNLNEEKVGIFTKALKDLVEAGLTETDALVQNVLKRLGIVTKELEAQKAAAKGLDGNGLPDEAARAALALGRDDYRQKQAQAADTERVASDNAARKEMAEGWLAFYANLERQRQIDLQSDQAARRELALGNLSYLAAKEVQRKLDLQSDQAARRELALGNQSYLAKKAADDAAAAAAMLQSDQAARKAMAEGWQSYREQQIQEAARALASDQAARAAMAAGWTKYYDDMKTKEQEFQERFRATISGSLNALTSSTGGIQAAMKSILESFRSYAVQMATKAIMTIRGIENAVRAVEAFITGNPILALLMLGGALALGSGGGSGQDDSAFEEQKRQWEEAVSRISDALKSAFSASTYGEYLKTFGERLKQTVVDQLSEAFMQSAAMKPMMERLTAMIQSATADGILTAGETDSIRLLYQQISQMGGQFWQQLKGINFNLPAGGTSGGGVIRTAPTGVVTQQVTVQLNIQQPTYEGAVQFAKTLKPILSDLAASAV